MMEHILDYVVNFHEVVIILSKRKEIIKEILRILKEKKKERGRLSPCSSWPIVERKIGG